ncbi:serine protease [Pseudonocardiaceae bacterium YIM PH 21723]|nr:serine protease [Pseudonocardiaceae bacterium YIM PH 21723]
MTMRGRSLLVTLASAAIIAAGLTGVATVAVSETGQQIIGGKNATEPYPFVANFQYPNGRPFCGGSLIKPDVVLTASHCMEGWPTNGFQIRIGSNDRTSGGTVAKAASITRNTGPDLALVKLTAPVSHPVIAIPDQVGPTGSAARLLGWGRLQNCPGIDCPTPTILQEFDTTVLADETCRGIKAATELCVDSPNGTGVCHGDSGGPAIQKVDGKWTLIGVTSRLSGGVSTCGSTPTIYVDTAANRAWINQALTALG